MTRRAAPALALLLLAACGGSGGAAPANLVLVTLDCARADRFEHPELTSELPLALASFAAESARFTGLVACAPETLPAAAAIHTGRHPRELGRPGPDAPLPADVPTLAEVLAAAGFDTAAFVGPCTLAPGTGIARGFARYSAPAGARDEDSEVFERAREWLLEPARAERRFFLWVHLSGAHGPYRLLEESPFNPLNFFYKWSVAPDAGADARIPFANGNSGVGGVPEYQRVTAPALRSAYTRYHDARWRVGDWFANGLRHVLKATGRYDRTVFAVCGTHGESLGEHGVEVDHGEDLHREALETPLMIGVPGRPPETVARTVSQVDLLPTLLAALRVPAPESSGRDLLAAGAGDGPAFSELWPPLGPSEQTSATHGARRIVRTPEGAVAYDLARDPGELRGAPPAADDPLLRALEAFEARPVRATPRSRPERDELGRLFDLGYVLARFAP